MKLKRALRYTGLAFSILVGLWIIIITAIYFLVDVDDIKKLAQKAVHENTRGELEIGDMKLKVFPLVYFQIDGLVFKASEKFNRETIFACKESKLSFNLFSLIFGKPSITLRLNEPDLNISSDGKTNSLSDVIIPSDESTKVDVSAYLFISRILFKIDDADLKYKAPAKLYSSKGLDMELEVDPVLRSISLDTVIPVDAKDKAMTAKGDVSLMLKAHLSLNEAAKAELKLDATKLEIVTASFNKPKGTKLSFDAKMDADTKAHTAKIQSAELDLAGKLLSMKGEVLDYEAENPKLDIDVRISPSSIEKLIPLFTSLKGIKASGALDSKAKIKGSTAGADIALSLDATNVDIKGESFEKPKGVPCKLSVLGYSDMKDLNIRDLNLILVQELLSLKGTVAGLSSKEPYFNISAATPKYDIKNFYKLKPDLAKKGIAGHFNLKASAKGTASRPIIDALLKYEDGKNNLSLTAVSSDKNPDNITAKIYSSYVDIDKYTGGGKDKKTAAAAKKDPKASASSAAPIDRNKPIVEKETIKSMKESIGDKKLSLSAKIDKAVYSGLDVKAFTLDAYLDKNVFNVSSIKMNLINSDISAGFKMLINDKSPAYSGNTAVKGLKATEAIGAFFPSLKGVIDGVLTGDMAFSSNGFTIAEIAKALKGNGKFSFDNFRYSAQDLNVMLKDKVGGKIEALGVPKEKLTIKANPGWETVQGVFNIAGEKINIEKIYGKDKEYEVNGKGVLGFDERMDMYLDFVVPYKNIPYEALKLEGQERSMLAIHMDGPAVKPRFDGPYTIKFLAEKAFSYEKKKVEAAVKKETEVIKKKASEEVKKAAEPVKSKIKDAIKGLRF